ncbi:MAG: Rieske 2Fe-2S domain-containing protein [Rubrivivax sp.]|nr:Rieske 2Fe-2S domain-containing protein [Rubrivivax sp.]
MAESVEADGQRLPLCASAELAERGRAWVWDVLQYGRPARAFAVRFDGVVVAYLNRCTHVPAEMDWQPGEFFDAERQVILCAMHGATFAPGDGRCLGGPARAPLTAIGVAEDGGQVYWYPSRDIRPLPPEQPAPGSAP